MKTPGPDHPITIEPHTGRLRVACDGVVIADTTRALVLQESTYPAVFYVPREDADMSRLVAPTRNYFSIEAGGATADNAVWSYERPYPAMAEIAGHLAFYPNKVSFERE